MAVIEVHSDTKISIYEVSDQGYGIDMEVDCDEEGRYGIWVGARGLKTWRCLGSIDDGELPLALAEAMTVVGQNEGWQTVKVNGSVVWSSEAVEAVRDALGDDEDRPDHEDREDRPYDMPDFI